MREEEGGLPGCCTFMEVAERAARWLVHSGDGEDLEEEEEEEGSGRWRRPPVPRGRVLFFRHLPA